MEDSLLEPWLLCLNGRKFIVRRFRGLEPVSIAPDAQEDRAAELAAQIVPTAPWRVVSVKAEPDYRLEVRFVDGTAGCVNIREIVASPEAGVFKALRDPDVFARVYVSLGAVTG